MRRILGGLVRRDDPSPELLAYRAGPGGRGAWRDVRSSDINDYVREVLGMPASAKDWHADPATHGAVERAVLDLLTPDGEAGGGQGLRRPAR